MKELELLSDKISRRQLLFLDVIPCESKFPLYMANSYLYFSMNASKEFSLFREIYTWPACLVQHMIKLINNVETTSKRDV